MKVVAVGIRYHPYFHFIMIKTIEIHEWERWYAWYPVIIVSGTNFPYKRTTVWREYVERKYWGNWAGGGYEYRLEVKHDD